MQLLLVWIKTVVPVKYNVRYQDGSTDTVTHNEIIRARHHRIPTIKLR